MSDPPRLYAWNQLRATLRLLASPPEAQLAAHPEFVPTGDELVLEFEDFFLLVRDHARDRVTDEQWCALEAIDRATEEMSRRGDETLFWDDALRSDPTWESLRELAKEALQRFGWSLEERPGDGAIDELRPRP